MKLFMLSLAVVSCVVLGYSPPAHGCTAFYATDGEIILVGNNEDVPESLAQAWGGTHMWFIPPEDGMYGKVCFGYGDLNPYGIDFVQGGMNETGLFFDYFSTAFNEITESLDKPIYDDVLADKAMDEYSTVEEVMQLYDTYNLQAQYLEMAQVMFGDKFGNSAIIEGDSTITISEWYQVCTNFYHSCPELGGYPCGRYETAVEMLDNCSVFSTEFCRTVLDAVSSESTQYSHIYDLKSGMFYLFFHGNFKEFIKIDLQDELAKGAASYELSSLFADMRLVAPDDSAMVSSTSVTFRWSGKPNCDYQLYYSESPDFAGSAPIGVTRPLVHTANVGSLSLLLVGIVPLGVFHRKRGKFKSLLVLLVIVSALIVSCNMKGVMENEEEDGTLSITIRSLEPNTTYYWKVTARATDAFKSESVVRTFTTAS